MAPSDVASSIGQFISAGARLGKKEDEGTWGADALPGDWVRRFR